MTREELVEILDYDPATGAFRWRRSGKIAGVVWVDKRRMTKHSYLRMSIKRRTYHAHRLAWLYVHGRSPETEIDHVNGDGLDNRISNLREATASQNQANSGAQRHSKTGQRGIHLHACGRYRVQLQKDNRSIHVGYFERLGDAIAARDAAALRLHQEFAHLDRSDRNSSR